MTIQMPVGAVLVGEVHLVPNFGDGNGVEPFVIARAAYVVEMIVNARAAGAMAFLRSRQAADVAPIVIAPEQCDIIGNAHAVLVIALHFLVESPELRHGGGVRLENVLDELALGGDDFFEERNVGALGHWGIDFSAHRDGDDVFVGLVPLDAVLPEGGQLIREFIEVPLVRGVARTVPFLVRAHHRFDMRGTHDDSVFVREPGIQRVVLVETIIPHGGPEIIRLEPQQQFENVGVEGVIVAAEFFLCPAGEVRRLVIEESAAIFDRGRSLNIFTGLHKQHVLVPRGHILPKVPRRNADLLRQVVNAVNGPALVAAADDERIFDTGQGMGNDLQKIRFPFAGDFRRVDFPVANQLVDESAFADGADDDNIFAGGIWGIQQRRSAARDAGDVGLQIMGGADDSRPVVGVHKDGGCVRPDQGETPAARIVFHIMNLTQGKTVPRKREQPEKQREKQRAHVVGMI